MTFDPFSYPGPSSSGARFRDPAVGGGRDGRGDRRDRGRQGPAVPGGRWEDARSQAHRDPIVWAYDPSVQEGCDSHSRVDRPRAADHAADPSAGGPDPYDYGPAPRARGPYDYGPAPRARGPYDYGSDPGDPGYDYGADPRDEDPYDYDGPDSDYSRRGPHRTRHHRKLRAAARLFDVLMYARRLESSYYGPDPCGPAPYDYDPGPVPRDPYYGPGPWCPPRYVPYRYPPRPLYQHPPRYVPYRYALRRKSKVAAGLLGIFLGCFGAHNFYLGYTSRAVAQLLITLLSFGLLVPVSVLWGFIEGIIILCARPGQPPWGVDAHGVPLTS